MPKGKKSPVKRKTRKTSPRRKVSPKRRVRKTSPRRKKRMNGVLDRFSGRSSVQTGASPRLTQSEMDRITELEEGEERERRQKLRQVRGKRLGIELQRGVDQRALRTLSRDISRSRQTARRSMGLQGTDFRGQDLTGSFFTGEDLTGANFEGTNLTDVDFEGAILDKCKMNRATNLNRTNFRNASLIRMQGGGSEKGTGNFNGANFSGSLCDGANFSEANLSYTIFGDEYDDGSFVSSCKNPYEIKKPSGRGFTNINFEGAYLKGAKFININLSGSNFDRIDIFGRLYSPRFSGSNLQNTSFRDLVARGRSPVLQFRFTHLNGSALDAYEVYENKPIKYIVSCAKGIEKAIFRDNEEKKMILSIHSQQKDPKNDGK